MNGNTASGEFEKQDDKEEFSNSLDSDTNNTDFNTKKKYMSLEPHLQSIYREPRLRDFDIEEPKGIQPDQLTHVEVIESWLLLQQEITRQELVQFTRRLFITLIFLGLGIGLIFYLITRKLELLVSPPIFTTVGGVLALLRKVFNYYFKRPKK